MKKIQRIGVMGYGEVGKTFALGLIPHVQSILMWDIKLSDASQAVELTNHAKMYGIAVAQSVQDLCSHSDLIISCVTASQTKVVAQSVASFISKDTFFLDLNSASPGTKQSCSDIINAAGGVYVEAGVMTSVPPYGIRVPMLLGGKEAHQLQILLADWGCDVNTVSDQLGVASAIKMCRSIMIKGLEALVIESYTTARHYGVEDHMLATMAETFPTIDWPKQGAYFYSRVVQHGKRRAEEMRESALTVEETGVVSTLTSAIATKHDWIAGLARDGIFDNLPAKPVWQDYADRLVKHHK